MKIEFDSDKDAANRRKHGLSLAGAESMDFDTAIYAPDDRYDYGEDRTQALGLIGGRPPTLVFTMRGDALQAISLRKANPREVKRYDEKA
ncbi:MAG TPA: BrnT family toxin [Beijerinckiaceae bacterium]|nr:BrnT family toxin [Beijerinckiaceae bacterium]